MPAQDGSSNDPRSGVASVEMRIDGMRTHPEDLVAGSCSAGQCPYSLTASFTFHVGDFAEGDHQVDLIARDALADPSATTRGTHITVTSFTVHRGGPEPAAGSDPNQTAPPPPDQNSSSPNDPISTDSAYVTDLTQAQADSARQTVQLDAVNPLSDLFHVLGASPYQVTDIGPLTDGTDPATGKERTAGATMLITLTLPQINVDTTVPMYLPQAPGSALTVPFRGALCWQPSHRPASGRRF